MKNECKIIQDLLPLYADEVCSEDTRQMVEEHLKECSECRAYLNQLKNDEVDSQIKPECTEVVTYQKTQMKQKVKNKSFITGLVFAGFFMIPIVACFIINAMTASSLSWFFIVLSAMLIPVSMIVVPLMVPRHKFLWAALSTLISVILLLGVICLYSGGKWFYIAACGTLLGAALVLGPIVANMDPLKNLLKDHKLPIVMGVDTVLLIALLVSVGIYSGDKMYWANAAYITLPNLALMWFIVCLIRFIRSLVKKEHRVKKIIALCVGMFMSVCVMSACAALPHFVKQDEPEMYRGNAVITEDVNKIRVDWAAGRVLIKFHETDDISIEETSTAALSDAEQMRWVVSNGTLSLEYSQTLLVVNKTKYLTIVLPRKVFESISVNTSSADIEVQGGGLNAETIEIHTASGSVKAMVAAPTVVANSASGNISLTVETAQKVKINSASGRVRLNVQNVDELNVDAISGKTSVVLWMPFTSVKISSASADVDLSVRKDIDFTVVFMTASGEAESELPLITKGRKYIRGAGAAEDGSGLILVSTASGDLSINAAPDYVDE